MIVSFSIPLSMNEGFLDPVIFPALGMINLFHLIDHFDRYNMKEGLKAIGLWN